MSAVWATSGRDVAGLWIFLSLCSYVRDFKVTLAIKLVLLCFSLGYIFSLSISLGRHYSILDGLFSLYDWLCVCVCLCVGIICIQWAEKQNDIFPRKCAVRENNNNNNGHIDCALFRNRRLWKIVICFSIAPIFFWFPIAYRCKFGVCKSNGLPTEPKWRRRENFIAGKVLFAE